MLFKIVKEIGGVGYEILKGVIRLVSGELSPRPGPTTEETPQGEAPVEDQPMASAPPVEEAPVAHPDVVSGVESAPEVEETAVEKEAESSTAGEEKKEQEDEDKEEKPRSAGRGRPRKDARDRAETAAEVILRIITEAEDGIDTETLIEKTGFKAKKVHNNVYKLRKAGKIKNLRKGYYIRA